MIGEYLENKWYFSLLLEPPFEKKKRQIKELLNALHFV